ncbi:uncharacterized protein LOC142224814 [Haematobia irritans]|uniref:uncharacterized protein LOC142224814 n=1 Tax=Haematobia irritans TaxID=7368 RepID=UPI003F4F8AE7
METLLIAQHSNFKEDVQQLEKHRELKGSSQIKSLSPFLDETTILKVGDRLEESTFSFNAKHPMLLPFNDPISRLIFESLHKENKHCGPTALLAMVRQRFWPIKGKHLARETVHKCIQCARSKPKLLKQIMGNLPETRVTPASSRKNTTRMRNHFIPPRSPHFGGLWKAAVKSAKGLLIKEIWSATTPLPNNPNDSAALTPGHFMIGEPLTAQVDVTAQAISSTLAKRWDSRKNTTRMRNHFIPPRSPHFGGLWKAAVKSAKGLLIKEIWSACLTYEEMGTIVIENRWSQEYLNELQQRNKWQTKSQNQQLGTIG